MEKQSLLYFFPHVFLKDAVLNQWNEFRNFLGQEPEALKTSLSEQFNRLKEDPQDRLSNKEVTLNPEAFSSHSETLEDGRTLLIIEFPPPQDLAEVTYVGILIDNNPRLFTLELHIPNEVEKGVKAMYDDIPAENSYFVAEWVKEEGHKSYDRLTESSIEAFVAAIKKVL